MEEKWHYAFSGGGCHDWEVARVGSVREMSASKKIDISYIYGIFLS